MTAWIPVGWECAAADAFSQSIADVWPFSLIDWLLGSGLLFFPLKCDTYGLSTSMKAEMSVIFYTLETFHIIQSCHAYFAVYTGLPLFFLQTVKRAQTFIHFD